MFTGTGELVLRGGRRLPLRYEFVDTGYNGRAGHLAIEVSTLDPAVFLECSELHCADGVVLRIAVTSCGERNACFVGKVVEHA